MNGRVKRLRAFRKGSIAKKTMASHLLIACLAIAITTALFYWFGYFNTRDHAIEALERQAEVIAEKESAYLPSDRPNRASMVEMYQKLTDAAVFFVNREGEALHMQRYAPVSARPETSPEGTEMSDYKTVELLDAIDRKFIDRIFSGETVAVLRRFEFAQGVIIFAGAPIEDETGAIRSGVILAQPVSIMKAMGRELSQLVFVAAGIAIVLAVLMSVAQSRRFVRPVQSMIGAARQMADGQYDQRIETVSDDEIGELGRTLNMLSLRLAENIESLRDERDRLETVIGGIAEGILALDGGMRIVHYNLAFLSMLEIDSVENAQASGREDVARLFELICTAMDRGEAMKESFVNPSGRIVQAEVTVTANRGAGQVSAICLLTDVSESQRLEQLRRDYVANISHELRTPLTGIRGMIELLMDGYVDSDEERMSCYGVIHSETLRLERLVGEMLDLSRLQDGRMSIEIEPLELPGILGAAIRSMEPQACDSGITLALETDGTCLACMGNEARIQQVLVILLDNAIDFTPRGGRVTVSACSEGGRRVAVSVRDTGCGIEPRDLPMIWQRFYKADRSRMRTKGTGLGLSIAKTLVELMGGEIGVISEPGCGAEFTFTLNCDPADRKDL